MRSHDEGRQDSLNSLIEKAKRLPIYSDVIWDDSIWDVTAYQKGKSHKKRSYKLKFVRRTVGKVAPDQMIALPPLFSNFCKCFVKIKQSERNVSFDPLQRDLDAARILFNVMEESGVDGDVTLVKKSHFSIAEEFVVQRFTPSTAYRMSKALQNLAGFIDRYRLAKVRIGYKSTIKKPRSGDSRGAKGQAQGMCKMPTQEVFEALAEISSSPKDENELIRIRVVDLLVVGGFRIGEVLTLPVNCWVEKPQYADDGSQLVDAETGAPVVSYGLRYWPEKGAEPSIKWIPSHTVPLAKRAVDDLTSHCKRARERALILESKPDCVPLSDRKGADEEMTARSLGELVGARSGRDFVSQLKLSPVRIGDNSGSPAMYSVCEVEKALLKRRGDLAIRKGSGGRIQKLSDSLCVCFYNQFKSSATPFMFIAELINEQHISDFLGGKVNRKSAFSRRGFKDDQGRPLRVNTHAFRHWLNSIADHGGLNELQLARWMGRKDVRHNEAYKHGTVAQRVDWAKRMIAEGGLAGPVVDVYHGLDPVDREQFLEAHVNTVHFTHFGLCLQDYSIEPCEYHLQCLHGCLNYLRTKGNVRERANLKKLEELLELQIERLGNSDGEGFENITSFEAHAIRQLNGVKSALSVDEELGDASLHPEYVSVFGDKND